MRAMLDLLADIGVPDEAVRFEFFGPQSSPDDGTASTAPRQQAAA